MVRGRASKQQRNSGGRPRHVANFVGNQEASESDEDCAFAFMVSETKEDILENCQKRLYAYGGKELNVVG